MTLNTLIFIDDNDLVILFVVISLVERYVKIIFRFNTTFLIE